MEDMERENARLKEELAGVEADMETFREKVKFKLASQISERRRWTERADALGAENAELEGRLSTLRAETGGEGSSESTHANARKGKVERSGEEEAEAAMLIEHIREAEREAAQVQKKVRIKLQHLVIEKHALNIRLQELEDSENSVGRMQEMRTALAQLLDDKATLMQQWTELKGTMENAQLWQTQNKQLERQIQLVESQKADAQSKLLSLTDGLNANVANKARLRDRKRKLGTRIEKRKKALAAERASQKNASMWSAQNEFLRVQLEKIKKANIVLAAKVEDAQAVSLDSSNSREGAALTDQVASNEAARIDLEAALEQVRAAELALESERGTLTEDVEALVAEVMALKMKIQSLTRSATQSAAKNATYRRDLLNVLEEKGLLSLRVNELLSKLKLLEEWEEENDELYFGIQELLDENARLKQRMYHLRRQTGEGGGDGDDTSGDAMDVSLNAATDEILGLGRGGGEGDGEEIDRFAEMRRTYGLRTSTLTRARSGSGAGTDDSGGASGGGGGGGGSGGGDNNRFHDPGSEASGDGSGSGALGMPPGKGGKTRSTLRRLKGRTYSEAKLNELQSLLQDSGDASDVTARIQKDAEAAARIADGGGGGALGEGEESLSLSLMDDDSPDAYFADRSDIKYAPRDGSRGGSSTYPVVIAGSLYRLVERLTFEKYPDMEYVQAFMLTYRSFTTPIALMEQMIARYCITPPASLNEEEVAEFKKRKLIPIRLRVYNVLRGWVDKYFRDFEENEELLTMLKHFASNIMKATGMKRPASALLSLLDRKLIASQEEKANKLSFESLPPPPKSQVISNPLSVSVKDLARNMCLLEMQMYQAIPVTECLNNRWSGKKAADSAPMIFRTIAHFNRTTMWVTTEVVRNTKIKPKARAKIIAFFIKLAMELKSLNNLNGVMEIMAGLANASVKRLKKAWARVDSKLVAEYDSLKALTSNFKSYSMLRNHIHICKPPCIPYLGVSLTDLTFIEDGNQDHVVVNDDVKLINFSKRKKIVAVIQEIQRNQQTPYNLLPVTQILRLSHKFPNIMDEKQLYRLSLAREPRNADREEIM